MISRFRRRSFFCLVLNASLLILSTRTAIFGSLISLTEGRNDLAFYSIAPLSLQCGGLLSLLFAGRLIKRFPPRRLAQAILLCSFASVSGMIVFHDAGPNTLLLLFLLALCISPFEPLSHYLVGLIEKQSRFRLAHSVLVLAGIVFESAANAFASLIYPTFGIQLNFTAAAGFALLSLLALRCMPIPEAPKNSQRRKRTDGRPGFVYGDGAQASGEKPSILVFHRLAIRESLASPRIVFLAMCFVLYVALLSSLQAMVIPLMVAISGPRSLALVQLMFACGFIAGCVFSTRFQTHERQFVVALVFNCLLILCGLLQPKLIVFLLVALVTGFFPPLVISTATSEVQKSSSRELQPYAMSLVSLAGSLAAISGAALVLLISFCLRFLNWKTALGKPLLTIGIAAGLYLLLSLLAAGWLLKQRSGTAQPVC